jgi:hypothetical protein
MEEEHADGVVARFVQVEEVNKGILFPQIIGKFDSRSEIPHTTDAAKEPLSQRLL